MQHRRGARTVFVHLEDELLAAGRPPLLLPLELRELDLLAEEEVVGDDFLCQSLVLIRDNHNCHGSRRRTISKTIMPSNCSLPYEKHSQ